ncbi:MAG: hypothetical protein AAF416_08515 [Pseudomonadota bacterium]
MDKRLSDMGVGHAYAPTETEAGSADALFVERVYEWVLSLSHVEQTMLSVAAATLVLMAVVVVGNRTAFAGEKNLDEEEEGITLSDRAELDKAIQRMKARR